MRRLSARVVGAALGCAVAALVAVPAVASAGIEPAPDTYPNEGTRLLVIGDSITGNPGCWRAYMWRDLTDAGYEINMVGTRHDDECGGLTNAAGATWDPDNTGISGITTAGMSVRVGRDGLLQRTTPEAVVMMLGTNDLMSGDDAERIMGQYEFMVDVIRRDMPAGPIVIAAPPPIAEDRCPGCQAIVDEISAGLGAWAEAKSTPDSPVFAVVHSDEFSSATDMHDGIHPTDSGEVLIAAAMTPVVMEALDYSPDAGAGAGRWLTFAALGAAGVGIGLAGFLLSRKRGVGGEAPPA